MSSEHTLGVARQESSRVFIVTGAETPPVYMEKVVDSMRAEGKAILDDAARVVREHALEPQTVLLEAIGGRAADLIVEQAKKRNAELIVMGTHGRRGLRRLTLGSDAELVVRSSPVPVLLVRTEARWRLCAKEAQ